ncbi:MAG: 3-dehydroquinate synthase [Planctomycetota bacterium]|jgi:3-dehydroquinate synthase
MAQIIHVATTDPYDVQVGQDLLGQIEEFTCKHSGVAVLTDDNVADLYLERLGPLAKGLVITVAPGEDSKSFATLEKVLEQLAKAKLDRGACLVALGGGVVGDLTGLTAALYKRGIDVVQCPTTLLAQVDASVGGKTAVNLPSGKNLAGIFHQPIAVFADVTTLSTLPEDEFQSGLGEVLKTAILAGDEAISALEQDTAKLLARDPLTLEGQVERCVAFKAKVVTEDPHESGLRMSLNLGHTFAHAIEHIAGFGVVPHGVAVAAGIGLAFERSERAGILEDSQLTKRVQSLTSALGLPGTLGEVEERYGLQFADEAMTTSMLSDKKNKDGKIRFVLPVRAGEMKLGVVLP